MRLFNSLWRKAKKTYDQVSASSQKTKDEVQEKVFGMPALVHTSVYQTTATQISPLEDIAYTPLVGSDSYQKPLREEKIKVNSMEDYNDMNSKARQGFVKELFKQYNESKDKSKFLKQKATWKVNNNTYKISQEILDCIFFEQEKNVKQDVIEEYNKRIEEERANGKMLSWDQRVEAMAKNMRVRFAGKNRILNKSVIERLLG